MIKKFAVQFFMCFTYPQAQLMICGLAQRRNAYFKYFFSAQDNVSLMGACVHLHLHLRYSLHTAEVYFYVYLVENCKQVNMLFCYKCFEVLCSCDKIVATHLPVTMLECVKLFRSMLCIIDRVSRY